MYVQQYIEKRRGELAVILNDTSLFLESRDKLAFLKEKGKPVDAKLLDQYKLLDEYVPIRMSDDFDALAYLIKQNLAIASVIPTGGEIPQTRYGRFIEFRGSDPFKLAISHVYNEQDQIDMLKYTNMSTRFQSRAFADMIFGSVDSLQPRIVKLSNVLTWQGLSTGQVAYTDPRSGAEARLSYQTIPELMPAPLTGNDDWSRYDTANGVRNLQDHSQAFYDVNGFYPDETIMSKSDARHLLRQQSTLEQARSLGLIAQAGSAGQTSVDHSILTKLAEKLEFPPIREYDAQYEIEIAPGQTVRGRYVENGRYLFMTKTMGERIWMPTIENDGKPGIHTNTEEVKKSPPEDRSYALGRMIPFFPEVKVLASRKVRQAA